MMHWSKPTVGGDIEAFKGVRSHTATVVGRKIYVFGGSGDDYFNDLLIFDTKTMYWSKPKVNGADGCIPSHHRSHSTTLVDRKLFVFGGGDGPGYFNDLYILDTKTLTWTKPTTNGQTPEPRRAHTANLVGKFIYIFGGGDGTKALNDVFTLDTETLTWNLIKTKGTAPVCRGYHTSVMMRGNTKIGIFGGSDGQELFSDFHQFDITTSTWSRIPVVNPSKILSQSSVLIGKQILAFGGHDASDYINTLKIYHVNKNEWEVKVCTGTAPLARGYQCCCFVDHRIFVIGGYDGTNYFNDVHVLDIGTFAYHELE